METIKEIAAACGVSEQSIRKWCKRNQVAKQRNQVSKESYVIDESTKQAILQYYHADASNGTSKPSCETKQPSCETEKSQDTAINALTEQLKEKDKQLAEKDKQLEALNQQLTAKDEQLAALTSAIAAAQEAQTRLTESLAAEQALHAGTIQKQLTMKDEKSGGFFGRLFGRKKKEDSPDTQE